MPNLRRIGAQAEDAAAEHLLEKGYTVVTRRYTTKGGEIDLIALDGDMLVFVEVRYRSSSKDPPEGTITRQKAQRWRRAAQAYLSEMGEPERECRFDVVAVTPTAIRHHLDALHFE